MIQEHVSDEYNLPNLHIPYVELNQNLNVNYDTSNGISQRGLATSVKTSIRKDDVKAFVMKALEGQADVLRDINEKKIRLDRLIQKHKYILQCENSELLREKESLRVKQSDLKTANKLFMESKLKLEYAENKLSQDNELFLVNIKAERVEIEKERKELELEKAIAKKISSENQTLNERVDMIYVMLYKINQCLGKDHLVKLSRKRKTLPETNMI